MSQKGKNSKANKKKETHKAPKYRRKSNYELLSQIEIQYKLIMDYISLINKGNKHFFLPLATSLRILLFDNNFPGNISLLEYFIKKFNINAFCFSPQTVDELPIPEKHLTLQTIGSYIWLKHDPENRFYNLTSLTKWKKRKLVKLGEYVYTPFNIIRTFTDQEGATHIDPKRKKSYDTLANIEYYGKNIFKTETEKLIVDLTPIVLFYIEKIIKGINLLVQKEKRLAQYIEEQSSSDPLISLKAKFYIFWYENKIEQTEKLIFENLKTFKKDDVLLDVVIFLLSNGGYYNFNIELLEEWLSKHPKDYRAMITLSNLYQQFTPNINKAYSLLNNALQIKNNEPNIYYNLFVIETTKLGLYDQAEKNIKKCIQLTDEKDSKYFYSYAHFLYEYKKDYKLSEVYYKKALEIDPFNPNILNDLGWLYEKGLKNYKFARYYYWAAVKINPELIVARNNYNYLNEKHFNKT